MEKIATTARLDADEHALLRSAAAHRRLTINQAVGEAIRLWLSMCGLPASPAMNGHPPSAGQEQDYDHG